MVNINNCNEVTTRIQSRFCNLVLSSLDSEFGCISLQGATDYEYSFLELSTGKTLTRRKGNSQTNMKFSWVSGANYNSTYSITVRALIDNNWTSFGSSCEITTPPDPSTQLIPNNCNYLLSSLDEDFHCITILGATNYEFRFVDISTNEILLRRRGNGNTNMKASWVSGIKYGTTYRVDVRSFVGDRWLSFGQVCELTTPNVLTTQLASDFCNYTLTSLDQIFYCNPISGATDYEYIFTDTQDGHVLSRRRGSSLTSMRATWVTGIRYERTYNVQVRAFIGEWTPIGEVCQLTTPQYPGTRLNTNSCGANISSMTTDFHCIAVFGADNYEYEFIDSNTNTVLRRVRGSSNTNMRGSWVSGMQEGIFYNVRVRARVGGIWHSYAETCELVINGTSQSLILLNNNSINSFEEDLIEEILLTNLSSSLTIYPNPILAGNNLYMKVYLPQSEGILNIKIYDLVGKVVYQQNQPLDQYEQKVLLNYNMPRGVYIVTAETGDFRFSERVIIQ
jgi:hypothetical protein